MENIIYDFLKNKQTAELITELKNNPSLLDFRDSRGASLLMLSSYFRNSDLTDYIVSVRGSTDLFEAAIVGDLDAVNKYLTTTNLNSYSNDGFTALGFAAFFSKPAVAKYLLERGADPNIPSNNDFKVAPLHSSVAAKSLEITQVLLAHGANPNVMQQGDITPLHEAAHNNSPAITQALLKAGADKNFKSKDGKTALDFAQEVGAKEIIALL